MAEDWSASVVEAYLHEQIPLARAMAVRVERLEGGLVELVAPLAANHNHLGTAFGGSLAAVATLAGYVCLWTAMRDRRVHVIIRRSEISYEKPVNGEIRVVCEMPQGGAADDFLKTFSAKGKARLWLSATAREGGEDRVVFRGEFVAIR